MIQLYELIKLRTGFKNQKLSYNKLCFKIHSTNLCRLVKIARPNVGLLIQK